jgi:ABC-2 type transport system permease protein
MSGPVMLFLRTVGARAYPRVVGMLRQPSWVIHEAILPILSVAAYAYIYRAMKAPDEFIGFVLLGGAMTAFWLNVLWSMGAQLYWERSSGNLEIYIMAPTSLMAVLAGMAVGGMLLTFVRATIIMTVGMVIFQIYLNPTSWPMLIFVFLFTLLALYGLGMMFASLFLLWGREAWHIVNLLQEPVYLVTGMNFPLKIFPTAIATTAMIIPLACGMDAMRQILFNIEGFWPIGVEISLLAVLAILFIWLAKRFLLYIERLSREEGKLTVKWQ